MLNLKNPGTSGIIGGLIAVLVCYINNKLTKNKIENVNYLKLFILVFVIIYIILYINKNNIMNKQNGGFIHTGNPNF